MNELLNECNMGKCRNLGKILVKSVVYCKEGEHLPPPNGHLKHEFINRKHPMVLKEIEYGYLLHKIITQQW